MPSRSIEMFLVDIIIAIDKAKRHSQGHQTAESLVSDEKSFAATLRELEIVGEAMKYIINHRPFNHLVMPGWRLIIDLEM